MKARARWMSVWWLLISLCLLYGGWLAYRQHMIRDWSTTQATVFAFDAGIDPEWGGHWYANPQITYEYRVADCRYESTRLNPSPFNYQSKSSFQDDTSSFAPGEAITVWYNPANPEMAYVVNNGITAAPVILFCAGVFLAGIIIIRNVAIEYAYRKPLARLDFHRQDAGATEFGGQV